MARKLTGNGGSRLDSLEVDAIRRLSDPQLVDRALGVGSGRDGTLAGKANAIYADVDLTGVPSLSDVRVSHRLGRTPVFCTLIEARNAGGAVHPTASPILKNRWNATTCRVAVDMHGGNQAGTVLKFRVEGE